ncbi:uncharacterized protein LOC110920055 [Helianthus annuus]|uniref:uncharacterized protein LOC110920055 n=1 Tax=Helianthus annuus TaxID=4232 RepID=UPI000B8F2943|nr:uncharacterized protein LOC110920055 [Helianthus annuus]
MSVDAWDEYLRMSSCMCRNSLDHFCKGIGDLYERRNLRSPTSNDIPLLYAAHQGKHDFSEKLGTSRLHALGLGGMPDCLERSTHPSANNDLVVLQSWNLFDDKDEVAPDSSFYANDVHYKYEYHLIDGIYPEWTVLMKILSCHDDGRHMYYRKKHESTGKDIEQVFGVLKKC